jgi:hypothetical protein
MKRIRNPNPIKRLLNLMILVRRRQIDAIRVKLDYNQPETDRITCCGRHTQRKFYTCSTTSWKAQGHNNEGCVMLKARESIKWAV